MVVCSKQILNLTTEFYKSQSGEFLMINVLGDLKVSVTCDQS